MSYHDRLATTLDTMARHVTALEHPLAFACSDFVYSLHYYST